MSACRLGYEEHDGARYCFEHGGFLEAGPFYSGSRRCDRAAVDAPFHCYPCARGDHDKHKMNAWEPGIPCECPPCTIPYQHGPHLFDDGRTQNQCPGSGHKALCGCECHQNPGSMRLSGAQTRYDNGSKSGPESARTDRGQRPHPAKEL